MRTHPNTRNATRLVAAFVATSAIVVAGQGTAFATAAITSDYRFLKTLTSSAGTAPALANITSTESCASGAGNSFVTQNVDGRKVPVLSFPKDNGLVLSPAGDVVNVATYSIVILLNFDSIGTWERVLDFTTSTSDIGLYVSPGGHLNFWPITSDGSTPIAADQWVQVVLTRDSNNNVVGYVDGVQQWTFVDSNGNAEVGNNVRFFHDNDSSGVVCESGPGQVARIRTYGGALSASEVGALDRLPPKSSIRLNATSGPPLTQLTVKGANFGPSENVTLTFIDGGAKTSLGTATADSSGAFTKVVTVPSAAASGSATIQAKGATSALSAKQRFTVT